MSLGGFMANLVQLCNWIRPVGKKFQWLFWVSNILSFVFYSKQKEIKRLEKKKIIVDSRKNSCKIPIKGKFWIYWPIWCVGGGNKSSSLTKEILPSTKINEIRNDLSPSLLIKTNYVCRWKQVISTTKTNLHRRIKSSLSTKTSHLYRSRKSSPP